MNAEISATLHETRTRFQELMAESQKAVMSKSEAFVTLSIRSWKRAIAFATFSSRCYVFALHSDAQDTRTAGTL